jgi:hypothetical protein
MSPMHSLTPRDAQRIKLADPWQRTSWPEFGANAGRVHGLMPHQFLTSKSRDSMLKRLDHFAGFQSRCSATRARMRSA